MKNTFENKQQKSHNDGKEDKQIHINYNRT